MAVGAGHAADPLRLHIQRWPCLRWAWNWARLHARFFFAIFGHHLHSCISLSLPTNVVAISLFAFVEVSFSDPVTDFSSCPVTICFAKCAGSLPQAASMRRC